MRIDKVLWYLRLAPSRTIAQGMAEQGYLRVNSRRIERAHCKVAVGDVLTVPIGQGVRVLELVSLPVRRGPAPEARAHYRMLDGTGAHPIGAAASDTFEEGFPQS